MCLIKLSASTGIGIIRFKIRADRENSTEQPNGKVKTLSGERELSKETCFKKSMQVYGQGKFKFSS